MIKTSRLYFVVLCAYHILILGVLVSAMQSSTSFRFLRRTLTRGIYLRPTMQKVSISSSSLCANENNSVPQDKDITKNIVFLGTPSVAAKCLDTLQARASMSTTPYRIVGVVTQPPAPSGRNKKITKTPVHELADKLQIPVYTPQLAKDEDFLTKMESLGVDLFITAAYGNYLPKRFLSIAPFGTINIHPSLLPRYRGAAPVQRCLENGDPETGVTLLYSVLKMDAGPIVAQAKYTLQGDEKSSKVLDDCFDIGVNKLIHLLPEIFSGKHPTILQDDAMATPAPKLSAIEGLLDFSSQSARQIHNKCRAFSDWPGTYSYFRLSDDDNDVHRLKIVSTCVLKDSHASSSNAKPIQEFVVTKGKIGKSDVLQIPCFDGSLLGITEIQPAGKKIMDARSFINGMRGQLNMRWVPQQNSSSSSGSDSSDVKK